MSGSRAQKDQRASDRLQMLVVRRRDPALEDAIANDRIAILFQPLIEPATGRTVSVEALARWESEDSAAKLFDRATRGGLKERLSRFAQRKALRIAGSWVPPLSDLSLSINLLAEDLAREDYDQWLLREITAAGLTADRVTIEISESSLLADKAIAASRLRRLRDAGVQIAVDDFGTGYASLDYLTTLPLDTLKIDRALVADIVHGRRDRIVVRAMINLARELDLKVVVEGVETPDQLAILAEWGCDLYQGFLGAQALEEQELARFVGSVRPAPTLPSSRRRRRSPAPGRGRAAERRSAVPRRSASRG